MATNLVQLRTTEEFMSDYVPAYQPIYSLFLENSVSYPALVGSVDFKRMEAVGDLRAKHITPKDTEIKQLSVGPNSRTFKKYFLANQFTVSALQDRTGVEDVNSQVLDEHQKQQDALFLEGEGTAANNVVNNGLYWSADPNYILESSKEIDKGTAADHLKDMYTQILVTTTKADQLAGRKILVAYGDVVIAKLNSLYATSDASFRGSLTTALGAGWSIVTLPSEVTPASANGWIAVNIPQVKVHYTKLPGIEGQGVNEEKMYAWTNFLMGSMMVEVKASKGIIRQPVTFEV